ncbi:hypothetical protein RIF29_21721 [Crotalaria pallida]|uniref:Uncharacterized protein n=1 Tax=Crotalaria pallida TaxID=3830 RepID=A0AAN9IDP6_CROPI
MRESCPGVFTKKKKRWRDLIAIQQQIYLGKHRDLIAIVMYDRFYRCEAKNIVHSTLPSSKEPKNLIQVGSQFNWRVAFWGEAILMLPFPVLGFVMKPLQLEGFAPLESKQTTTSIETNVSETGGIYESFDYYFITFCDILC